MIRLKTLFRASLPAALGVLFLGTASQSAFAACQLNSPNGQVKHVVYITFDNVHLRRDNPNVPSDLEQMPNLLNFITKNGIVSGNNHTPLISHTAHDIVTALTGVYGERSGIPVANSYGFFRVDGSVGFTSSFLYWTALGGDGKPEMLNELGKTAPAPWVPYTRAGCDVGAFSVANIEFESVPGDVNTVFGATSPEGIEANNPALKDKANADFLGIAVHCAQGSKLCNNTQAKDDLLPDEPGGYTNFKALFGNLHVQPVISPSGPVKDLDGNVIKTAAGNPGFPNTFDPTATQSLGYAATMLEAGVQVVFVYIADLHDNELGGTFGPGEAGYVAQAKAYDTAFGKFFARLAADGITKDNTLFAVVPDENDHFVGGPPSPANCDGVKVPCTYAAGQKGEIDLLINRVLATQRSNVTPFSVHSDDAPNFYINGNPAPTDPVTRTMEHDLDALVVTNPITGNNNDKLSRLLADPAEMKLLHMITSSPARTPTFTMFGNDNYFFETGKGGACVAPTDCVFVDSGFAWNHGDFQRQITQTWVAMVGPGVKKIGRNDDTFTDHTDVRPTMLALLGLKDDYVTDGRVVAEWFDDNALPEGIKRNQSDFLKLAQTYKQLNAPLGELGRASLVFANRSVTGTDQTYANYLATIGGITNERDQLVSQIKTALNAAAFDKTSVNGSSVSDLNRSAQSLIDRVNQLAGHERHDDDLSGHKGPGPGGG